jgi:hypothetical protein
MMVDEGSLWDETERKLHGELLLRRLVGLEQSSAEPQFPYADDEEGDEILDLYERRLGYWHSGKWMNPTASDIRNGFYVVLGYGGSKDGFTINRFTRNPSGLTTHKIYETPGCIYCRSSAEGLAIRYSKYSDRNNWEVQLFISAESIPYGYYFIVKSVNGKISTRKKKIDVPAFGSGKGRETSGLSFTGDGKLISMPDGSEHYFISHQAGISFSTDRISGFTERKLPKYLKDAEDIHYIRGTDWLCIADIGTNGGGSQYLYCHNMNSNSAWKRAKLPGRRDDSESFSIDGPYGIVTLKQTTQSFQIYDLCTLRWETIGGGSGWVPLGKPGC